MDIQGPYDGNLIEKATYKEYQEGFNCIKGSRKLKKKYNILKCQHLKIYS
jgi:hypothetical protein